MTIAVFMIQYDLENEREFRETSKNSLTFFRGGIRCSQVNRWG
jgi:hypothetical protein